MKKKKTSLIVHVCLISFYAIFFSVVSAVKSRKVTRETISDTVIVTVVDTIPYIDPIPRDSIVVRHITKCLYVKQECDDSLLYPTDSMAVSIPITQKRYADSTYTAWVSGYHAALDSIVVYLPQKTTTITKIVTQKPKRWGIGLSAGYGITPTEGFQPYIGIGVHYNMLSF